MKKVFTLALSLSMMFTAVACSTGAKTSTPAASSEPSKTATTAPSTAPSKDPVKLRVAWWGGQARHDYTLKVIELYEKQNPNVKIEAEYAPFDDYWKKLAPQASANQLPDVIQMDISYLSQYGGKNQLADLTPYTKNGLLDVSSISPNALSGGEVGGKLVAMNLGVNALNTTLDVNTFKSLGITVPGKDWTWEDFDAIAAKAKAAGKQIGGFGVRHEVFFPYYLRTIDQKMYNADGTALGFSDDKPLVDYFKRYQKWYDAGYILSLDKESQKKGVAEEDEILLGNAVLGNGWSNQFLAVANLVKDRPLELFPLPGRNGNKGLFLKPSMYFSVTNNSKQKEEAAKFISFFVNDIEANKLIKGDRGVPVSSKVKDALKPLLSPNEVKIFDYVAWAEQNSSQMDPPNPVGSIEIEKLLKATSEQILYKKTTVEEAAAKFRKDANAILAKNKK
ncbi:MULTISPECIES: ABC transporter substrate-binding protein [unclassified Paenibacillus]|jgi:multiple sugar transport system substrate-binding protein|uniref:ABC transporter substrate-binding protein n=1 Tax=unclassified Paenibacillus TaxID=185978 RepID=UPI00277ECAA8|nr:MULTISPECIES: extracellular solute-binding protein [unclassified Paenibacillus]MDF2646631.1 carbohydrate transporter substrate-binding protein [Paenibacillus sp.]MDQ0898102.1 multiple sugar transport system substrate-binding protein [Paenibacillus sp. V4I7]MDQ0915890.1 multiple sugar transport system substrate-binding protein [Paenibacillus sp. V4I5]